MYFVYIAECSDGTLYTGWSTNLQERIKTHNAGRGARYTRSRLPVVLRYQEALSSKSEALKRERAIKGMTRAGKLHLIAAGKPDEKNDKEQTGCRTGR